jgi:DNA-binding MarR family transcriptional regulator
VHSHIDPDNSLGFALKVLHQNLRARMDAALAAYGLTTPQYLALALLAEHPGISNSELARRSAVTAPTMLRILDALDRADHITRNARSAEKRTRGIELTPSGAQRLAAAADRVQWFEELLRSRTSPEHVDIVLAWLHASAEALTSPDSAPPL